MQMAGKDAERKGFVLNARPGAANASSYDLTVAKIVIGGKAYDPPKAVAPQQVVILISQEVIKIPPGHLAYAMPKNRLCNEGILCLNTGIVDPGYEGPLSTIAINFSNSDHKIRKND